MIWLTGCAAVGSDAPTSAYPPVVDYSRAVQMQAAGELAMLPDGSVIVGMMSDYAVMREQARFCR